MVYSVGGLDVSRETYDDLRYFAELVSKWTPKINLISPRTVGTIWDRHIVDSVQIYPFAPSAYKSWVDIGSGGGFPGVVMAILGRSFAPDAKFTLIESDQRKATFLRTAARELNLSVDVIADRIEKAAPQSADVVSARALSALSTLIPGIQRHMRPNGTAILHKGKRSMQEVAEARTSWSFALEEHASLTDPDGRILVVQRISRAG